MGQACTNPRREKETAPRATTTETMVKETGEKRRGEERREKWTKNGVIVCLFHSFCLLSSPGSDFAVEESWGYKKFYEIAKLVSCSK